MSRRRSRNIEAELKQLLTGVLFAILLGLAYKYYILPAQLANTQAISAPPVTAAGIVTNDPARTGGRAAP